MTRILIHSAETNLRKVITETLEAEGYLVDSMSNGRGTLFLSEDHEPDMALIDWQDWDAPGSLELLDQVHHRWPGAGIIVLLSSLNLNCALKILENGATDYLVKPAGLAQIVESVEKGLEKKRLEMQHAYFISHLEEALSKWKCEAALTLSDQPVSDRFVQTRTLLMDRQKRVAVHAQRALALTTIEFDLLQFLARHADRVVTARELVRATQGYDLAESEARRIVRVHIDHLRRKLETDPAHPRVILNVRNQGYRFAE